MTLADKDGGKAARMCIDLRRVNLLLQDFQCVFRYGPAQVERVSRSSHRFRSSFDLASAYSQLPNNAHHFPHTSTRAASSVKGRRRYGSGQQPTATWHAGHGRSP